MIRAVGSELVVNYTKRSVAMADYDEELDATGLNCPLPILRAKKALNGMPLRTRHLGRDGDRGNQRAQEPRYVEEIYPFEGLATG